MINHVDNRYDSFFASILETHALHFNGDIRIISWNYDYQFEKAYSEYSSKNSLRDNQAMLRVHPDRLGIDEAEDGFSIYKINGTTGFRDLQRQQNANIFPSFDKIEEQAFIEKAVLYFLNLTRCDNRVQSMLSFAWEKNNNVRLINTACERIKNSEALVVIGYSFPFFNREVDKKIIQALSSFDKLKIYVQDVKPAPIVQRLHSVIPTGLSFQIIPYDNVDQFYLPPEL